MYGLLLCSDVREPVSQILIKHFDKISIPLIFLSLEDLLKQVEIFDEIIEGVTKIGWTLPQGRKVTNSKECFLINRALSVSESLFDDFHLLDKEYALAEFRAYLTFAIESFPLTLARPGPGGLSGNRFSLPQQWNMVQKSGIDLSIPDYYFGHANYSPFKNSNCVVRTTPYNYYYWRPGVPSCKNEEVNFCFLRPPGDPIICSVLGKKVFVFPYLNQQNITELIESKLLKISQTLAIAFNYAIAECLFFVEGDKITFGMISNIPYASRRKEFFAPFLIQACNEFIFSETFCAP